MTQDTITETRTETTTREITKHRCPLCETYHESDDLAVMKAGGHETDLCRYCAASIFDVDSEEIDVYGGETGTEPTPARESGSRLANTFVTILATAIVATVGAVAAAEVRGDIATGEFIPVSEVAALGGAILEFLPVVLVGLIAFMGIRMMTFGPRP
jgi:hypothetical protein